jgi:hypothetical protein
MKHREQYQRPECVMCIGSGAITIMEEETPASWITMDSSDTVPIKQ